MASKRMPDCPIADDGRGRRARSESDTLTGIVVPAGTPKEIVDRWHKEIARIVARPTSRSGCEAGPRAGRQHAAEFGARIKSESAKWDKVAQGRKNPDQLISAARKDGVSSDDAIVAALGPLLAAVAAPASASISAKPVRMIVPFAAGGRSMPWRGWSARSCRRSSASSS